MNTTLRIATRKSPLAMWQAEYVAERLRQAHPGIQVELLGMTTRADEWLSTSLAKMGGKGLFVKELEEAMLEGRADLAVHSMKDVPAVLPDGLSIGVICEREDARDAFVSNHYARFADLPLGACVGTSSLRRQCQLLARRPDLRIKPLRGNVQTRLGKLDAGEFDAIVLAQAGLVRLDMHGRVRESFDQDICLPAVGQGAVGIELRTGDSALRDILAPLHHQETAICVGAERAMNYQLGGSCQVPVAALARLSGDRLLLRGRVGDPDGSALIEASLEGSKQDYEAIGEGVAAELLARGAREILDRIHA